MFVKFENTDVHIFKLRKGTIVWYVDDYYHIKSVYKNLDLQVKLVLEDSVGVEFDVSPQFVTWLES